MAKPPLRRSQSRLFQPKEFQQVSHCLLSSVRPRAKVIFPACFLIRCLFDWFDLPVGSVQSWRWKRRASRWNTSRRPVLPRDPHRPQGENPRPHRPRPSRKLLASSVGLIRWCRASVDVCDLVAGGRERPGWTPPRNLPKKEARRRRCSIWSWWDTWMPANPRWWATSSSNSARCPRNRCTSTSKSRGSSASNPSCTPGSWTKPEKRGNLFHLHLHLNRLEIDWNWLKLTGTDWNWLKLTKTDWNWLKLVQVTWYHDGCGPVAIRNGE